MQILPRPITHKRTFKARFRRNAFGWKSRQAIERVKQAVAEIKRAARRDPLLGAEGAVSFLERVSPALERVDSSSGAIGTAVNKAIDELVPIIAKAPADGRPVCIPRSERQAGAVNGCKGRCPILLGRLLGVRTADLLPSCAPGPRYLDQGTGGSALASLVTSRASHHGSAVVQGVENGRSKAYLYRGTTGGKGEEIREAV